MRSQISAYGDSKAISDLQIGSEEAVSVMTLSREKSSVTLEKAEKQASFYPQRRCLFSNNVSQHGSVKTYIQ